MIEFVGDYFDGKSSRPHPAVIGVYPSHLLISSPGIRLEIPLSDVTIDPTVGTARSIVYLAEYGEIHTSDIQAVRTLETRLPSVSPENIARHLENKLLYAAAALAVTVLLIASFLRWGLPSLAQYGATIFPEQTEQKIGVETLHTLDEIYLDPTHLSTKRQQELNDQFKRICQKKQCPTYHLIFRNSAAIGPNAFALPANQIVITDQLIAKAVRDEEILAVLAHELGHIRHDHILRMMLQSIGSGLVLVLITGDISNYSDLSAGIPAILLQQGYSRKMEEEADQFALELLKSGNIPPHYFADILLRIVPDTNESTSLFSSHPNTQERIKPFLTHVKTEK